MNNINLMHLMGKTGVIIILFVLITSCSTGTKRSDLRNPPEYDLQHPSIIKLPSGLAEISGLSYYAKDTSVFAIEDEAGLLYKIFLTHRDSILSWKYDKKHDFEDLLLRDSTFYILVSNGDIKTLHVLGDSLTSSSAKFPEASKKVNEFESLYYDDSTNKLMLLCKDCSDDGHKVVSSWAFDPAIGSYTAGNISIDANAVAQKLGLKKIKLKPSATAIDPVDNNLYILASVNHLLIITDRSGVLKDVYELDPALYKQPEGIAFTPWGDMIVSNESHETGLADILVIKYKKNGQ